MDLYHYSSKPLEYRREITYQSCTHPHKPDGLWLSVGEAWADWCKGEDFSVERLTYLSKVTLSKDANILTLDTEKSLRDFNEEQGFYDRLWNQRRINWQTVAMDYDGVLIAPYQWNCRMDIEWYYSWDVASACIWSPIAVDTVKGES